MSDSPFQRIEEFKLSLQYFLQAVASKDYTSARPNPELYGVSDWLSNSLEETMRSELKPGPSFSPESSDVPLLEQIKCVESEVRRRQSDYPKIVAAGKCSSDQAEKAIKRMAAVLVTLQALQRR